MRFRTISALEDHLLELTSPERRSFVSTVSGSVSSIVSGEQKETDKQKKMDAASAYTSLDSKDARRTTIDHHANERLTNKEITEKIGMNTRFPIIESESKRKGKTTPLNQLARRRNSTGTYIYVFTYIHITYMFTDF